jgi:anti-anti-sigma factor
MRQTVEQWMRVHDTDNVHVVRFCAPALVEQNAIQLIGDELYRLAAPSESRLLLNLESVRDISSAMLAKIIELDRRLKMVEGRLVLCGLQPAVRDVFTVTHLHRILGIYADETEALAHF